MATRWERLAGDTAKFAVKMVFVDDPDEGRGVDADTSLSWGGFQIWVEGTNLCAHLEQSERVEYAYWYMLAFLGWLIKSWNPLFHEERLPCMSGAAHGWAALRETRFPPAVIGYEQEVEWEEAWQGWWSRHAVRAAREGGLFPDVVIRRVRDTVEVSCGHVRSTGTPDHVSFRGAPAVAYFAPRDVAEPLFEVIEGAVSHLAQLAAASSRIQDLVKATRRLKSRHQDSRIMWLAGLGSDEQTIGQGWRRCKQQLSSRLTRSQKQAMLATSGHSKLVVEGSCHAALMFGSVAPDVCREDVVTLAEHLVSLSEAGGEPELIAALCRDEPVDEFGTPPWHQGYDLAEEVRKTLVIEPSKNGFIDIEATLDRLSVDVREVPLTDPAIRGVALAGPHHRPGVGWNPENHFNRTSQGRRFTLAHELCHLLFDRNVGQRLAVASGPWAPQHVERRANAFAAMLLMPSSLLRQLVPERVSAEREVAKIAGQLRTGFDATLAHLRNLGWVEDGDKRRIEAEREARHTASFDKAERE